MPREPDYDNWIEGTPPDGDQEEQELVCCMCGCSEYFEATEDEILETNTEGWCTRCDDHTILEEHDAFWN